MKKRIGTLKGRPIVDGDINLVKYPEIHKKTLGIDVWDNGNPFKITLYEHIDSEGSSYYYRTVVFPVNVLIPEGVLVVAVATTIDSVSGLPKVEQILILNDITEVIPANVGVVVMDGYERKELLFEQTTEKTPFSYPFNGMGIYADYSTEEIMFLLQGLDLSAATLGMDEETNLLFTPLSEDSLIPKYTPLWVYAEPNSKAKLTNNLKLNHIFKKRNEFNIR